MKAKMPREEAQDLIDGGVVSSEKQFQQIKTQRNTYEHMFKLPDDLLLDIFMILKASSPYHRLGPWHRVNLVCRHWRRVACAAAVLWNEPPTDNHDFTLLMLERSRLADLHIRVDHETSTQTVTAILDHIGRIRSLDIDQDTKALRNTQDLLLGLNLMASRLEKLEITCDEYSSNPQFLLSPDLLRLMTPLRSLRLARIRYDWSILPLPNLTHLFLDCYTSLVAPITPKELVETFRQMQQLERLSISLSNILRESSDDDVFTTLPRLSHLSVLYEVPHDLNYILCQLSLPQLSYMAIICDSIIGDNDADYSRTIEAIGNLVNNGQFGAELRFLSLHDAAFMLSFFDQRICLDPSPRVRLYLPNPFLEGVTHLITEVPPGIIKMTQGKLSSLVHAEIGVVSNAQQVLLLLGKLPALQSIAMHNGLLAELTSAMTIPLGDQPDALPPFPKLESITWYCITGSSNELRRFRECLILRRNHGLPIKEMQLAHDVRISRSEVALLRNVVEIIIATTDIENDILASNGDSVDGALTHMI